MPTAFTPVSALAGGLLIGLAALLLYALLGRIAGISGILNNAIETRGDRGWRIAFLLGMVAAATAWLAFDDATPRSQIIANRSVTTPSETSALSPCHRSAICGTRAPM